MRILFAWELGENFGHLLKLLPVIKILLGRGHEVLVAAKNLATAETVLGPAGIPFLQAPLPARRAALSRDIASFADILAVNGFADFPTLSSLAHAWQHLFGLCRPDAIVLNHAPAALLAAHLSDIPAAELGTGFELPPRLSPYPCFRPWLKLPASALPASESHIVDNLNRLLEQQGRSPLERLCDLSCPTRLLTTFPEIDHYRQERAPLADEAQYLGPLRTVDEGVDVDWPRGFDRNVFVYLRQTKDADSILGALRRTEANIICVMPGIAPGLREAHAAAHLSIHERAVRLDRVLENCDLAVTHGGHGVMASCLLAGVPMLVLPGHIEQLMLAKCLGRNATGLAVLPASVRRDFAGALAHMLAEPGFGERARALAARYAGYDQGQVARHAADVVERLAR